MEDPYNRKNIPIKVKLLFLGMLALTVAFAATACSSVGSAFAPTPGREELQRHEGIVVDIQVNEDGRYSLLSDVEIHHGEHGVDTVFIEEPILLGYSVSSAHQGGVWILDLEAGETMLSALQEVQTALSSGGNAALADKIRGVIEQLEMAGPITKTST